MTDRKRPISITNGYRLQWEKAQDCYVLLYPEGLIKLNQTAGLIMSKINGQRNLQQIISELNIQFSGLDLDSDVEDFINTAIENRWITIR